MGKISFAVTPFYEIKYSFRIATTIVTIILAAIAYAKLKEISNDVIGVINNWKLKPYTDVYVAKDGESCASSYDDLPYKYGDWEGLNKGHCGCVSNPSGFFSTFTNCSVDAEASGYCMTSNSRSKVSASNWRLNRICFKRSGQSAASWDTGYVRRPYPDITGKCPVNYKKCGAGLTYLQGKSICFPESEVCPITSVTVAPAGVHPAGSGWQIANGTFSSTGHKLWMRREQMNELKKFKKMVTGDCMTVSIQYPTG